MVFCLHPKDVTDDNGALVKSAPLLMGQFAGMLDGFFDFVLLTDSRVKSRQVEESGRKVSRSEKEFFIHTIPPTRYHTCKAPGYFPAQMGGTYQEIMAELAKGEKTNAGSDNS